MQEDGLGKSFVTDGNFKAVYPTDPKTNYTKTGVYAYPTIKIDLEKSVPVYTIQINGIKHDSSSAQAKVKVKVGNFFKGIS